MVRLLRCPNCLEIMPTSSHFFPKLGGVGMAEAVGVDALQDARAGGELG